MSLVPFESAVESFRAKGWLPGKLLVKEVDGVRLVRTIDRFNADGSVEMMLVSYTENGVEKLRDEGGLIPALPSWAFEDHGWSLKTPKLDHEWALIRSRYKAGTRPPAIN